MATTTHRFRHMLQPFENIGSLTMPSSLRMEIFPEDLQRCIDFYTKVLRFEVLRQEDDYASLRRDNIHLGALAVGTKYIPDSIPAKSEYRRPPTGVEVVIEVDDVDQERKLVLEAGWPLVADIKLQTWGLRDFRLTDPDGYYLRFTDRYAKA